MLEPYAAYGYDARMSEMRKVTVNLPAELVDDLPQASGKSLTEAIRAALVDYRHGLACDALLALRGKVQFSRSWEELRGKHDQDKEW